MSIFNTSALIDSGKKLSGKRYYKKYILAPYFVAIHGICVIRKRLVRNNFQTNSYSIKIKKANCKVRKHSYDFSSDFPHFFPF